MNTIRQKMSVFGSGIGRRMIIWILLFSSFITFLGTSLQLYVDYAGDVKNIEKTMAQIESSYIQSIASSLWMVDYELIDLQLQGILKLPEMQYLEIWEGEKILLKVGQPQNDNVIRKEYSLNYNHKGKVMQLGTLKATASMMGVYN
ncbi:MAG: hypothetical protein L3J69_16295 [Desulfobacula sp.]|nr:hypothetical protein [Desulfobacula sp.]